MSFPRYERYKDSRHDWLGDVPFHWGVAKFRHYFPESAEKIDGTVEGVMLSVSGYRGIEVKQYEDENQRRTEDNLVGYRIVRPGQLVVNTMWLNYAGLGVSDLEGHVSPAYRAYWIDDGLEKRFVHHLMRSQQYVLGYTKFLTGVRPNSLQMGRDDLMVFPVLVPPIEEQRSIATFLDQETAKVDALIEEQRRLIELLKEKRQAVISHAVTKGLCREVSLRDSRVASFGLAPCHWKIRKIHALARVGNGSTPSRERFDYWDGGDYPWLSSTVVNQEEVTQADQFVTEIALKECHLPKILPPAVLIGITGQGKTRGMATTLRFEATINQHIAAIVPRNSEIDIEFLRRVFDMLYIDLRTESEGGGSTKGAITCEQIQNLRIALPPVAEQVEIASWIRARNEEFVALIEQTESAIGLLEERRSALISAAVTGKVDVRNYSPKEAA